MTELLLPGVLSVESEFTHGLTAACGPNAAGSAARWADQSATTPDTYAVYQQMRALGLGSANGASVRSNLIDTLRSLGYPIVLPGVTEAPSAFVARLAGTSAVVLEVANGQAFRDELTGATEDAGNLQYHYVCVLGRNTGGTSARALPPNRTTVPAGYWVADGDNNVQNPIINGVRVHRGLNGDLVYYSDATVAAAQPYSVFAVAARKATMMVPTGWKDDGTTLTAPNGVAVVGGMRDYVLNYAGGWPSTEEPLGAEAHVTPSCDYAKAATGPGVAQFFRHTHLVLPDAPTNHHVQEPWEGAEIRSLSGALTNAQNQNAELTMELSAAHTGLDSADAAIASLKQQLTAANSQIAALQAQVAQLQQSNPIAAQALDVMTRMKALFGEL